MRIKVTNNQQREEAFKKLREKDIKCATWIEQKEIRRKRTLNQNAGYWLWLTFLQEQTGSTKMELHDYFLDRYPIFNEVEINGKIRMVRIGTSGASIKQMSDHMNKIQIECSREWGIELPELEGNKIVDMYNDYREKGLI